jgi:hypothetical protein
VEDEAVRGGAKPHDWTSSPKRLLNAPFTSASAFLRTPFRTAASMKPVADEVDRNTSRSVRKTSLRPTWSFCMSVLMPAPRCPIIGLS